MSKEIVVGKIYKIDRGEFELGYFYDVLKVTKVCEDKPFIDKMGRKYEAEGYFLEYPSNLVAIQYKDSLIPIIPELSEIRAIKGAKISQDDINDVLIDLNIPQGAKK